MSLVLRQNLSRRLTVGEMDGNFTYLEGLVGGGSTFSENTYASWSAVAIAGGLPTGQFIEITDRADAGVLLYCSATNSFALEGTGLFRNADYQAVGNYSNVEGFNSWRGVWNINYEHFNITYNFLSTIVFNVDNNSGFNNGDQANTNNSAGVVLNVSGDAITYLIVSGDPTGNIWVYDSTSDSTANIISQTNFINTGTFSVTETLTGNNGSQLYLASIINSDTLTVYRESGNYNAETYFTGNSSGFHLAITATSSYNIANGDMFIWNNTHYLVTDETLVDGNSPDGNSSAYYQMPMNADNGYIYEWDVIIYDFFADNLKWRIDKRSNKISLYDSNFQFGDNNIHGVVMSTYESYMNIINNSGYIVGGTTGLNGYIEIDQNQGSIYFALNGTSLGMYITNNTNNIECHIEGYNSGLNTENNSGDIKVYIYDYSNISANNNTGNIFARYNDSCYISHNGNNGDIYYAEFKSFRDELYLDIVLLESESISYSVYQLTTARLLYLQENNLLIPTFTYEITDNLGPATTYGLPTFGEQSIYNVDNWIRLKALSNNTFEKYGLRSWKVPIMYSSYGTIGLPVFNTSSSFTYSVNNNVCLYNQNGCTGSAVIWGGWIWVNTTGNWGAPASSLYEANGQISLDGNWDLVNKNSGADGYDLIRENYYKEEISEVIWNQGRIEWIRDSLNNEMDIVLFMEGYYSDCILPALCSIDFFQLAQEGIYSNKNQLLLNNFLDGSAGNVIYYNTDGNYGVTTSNSDNAQIYGNYGDFGLIWNNTLAYGSVISGNQMAPYAYIENNILIHCYFNGNTIQNWSGFWGNTIVGAIVSGNFLFNTCTPFANEQSYTEVYNCAAGFSLINTTLDNSYITDFNNNISGCIIENSFLENYDGSLYNCNINGLGSYNINFNLNNLSLSFTNSYYTPYKSTFDCILDYTYLTQSTFTNSSTLHDLMIPSELSFIGNFTLNLTQSYNILKIIGNTNSLPIHVEPSDNNFNLYSVFDPVIENNHILVLSYGSYSSGNSPIYATDSNNSYMVYPVQYWPNSGVGSFVEIERKTKKLSINKVINYGGWVNGNPPTLTTTTISSVLFTTAMSGGVISDQGSAPILAEGVCWNTSGSPTLIDSHTNDGTTFGSFTSNLTGLVEGTTYHVRAYATNLFGTSYGNVLTFETEQCLVKGTKILCADRSYKNIEDITYDDNILTWNFDEGKFDSAKPLWIMKPKKTNKYNLLKFSDGSELKTIVQHRIFNKEKCMFSYPMTEETPIGTTTFNSSGNYIKLISKEVVFEDVEYYNVITKGINLFANDILTSSKFNNIYPIVDMKFVKDDRKLRNEKEFNVSYDYIDYLRLKEQKMSLEEISRSINIYEKNKS